MKHSLQPHEVDQNAAQLRGSTVADCRICGRPFVRQNWKVRMGWNPQFCSRVCKNKLTVEMRFWDKVKKSEGDGCWIWTASAFKHGYGAFGSRGVKQYAHRLSWEMHNGKSVPDGLLVLHHCDVKLCVRPSHLYVGTVKDNSRDAVERGLTARGEKHGAVKSNEKDVLEMRRLYSGGMSYSDLSERYGLSKSGILGIVSRKRWRHVP